MAFQLPTMPNFNVQQPDVLGAQQKMLELRALQGNIDMQPVQRQAAQQSIQAQQGTMQAQDLANQQASIDLANKKAYNSYWSNPDAYQADSSSLGPVKHQNALASMLGINPDDPLLSTIAGQVKAGVPMDHALAEAKTTLQFRQEISKTTQEQQAIIKNSFEQAREIAAPILAENDANKKQALIDTALPGLQRVVQYDPSLAQVIPTLHAGNFDAFANRIGAEEKALDYSKKQTDKAKEQQDLIDPATGLSPNTLQQLTKEKTLATDPAIQAAKLHLATAEKAAEQTIADGDPKAAAQLLIDGTVAPSQLISSRKPAFAQQAFTAAAQMQPGWTATKADADYKVASSPGQVAFFGSAKSLTDKGGTLDQLAAAGKDIPDNEIPVFNTIADAIKASTGSGPVAKYAAVALGVADDYSKVMGGGQGSDTSREQALRLVSAKQSPEQRAASIEGIRGAVGSQTGSRIGNNPVLQKMYGSGQPNQGVGDAKTLSMAQIQQAAKDHGVSIEETKRQAIHQGYTIK